VNEVDKAAFIAASKDIYAEFDKATKGGGKLIADILALAK
jgi:hypothetical protein